MFWKAHLDPQICLAGTNSDCGGLVRVMANICSSDVRSSTGSNLLNIEKEAKLDLLRNRLVEVRTALLCLRTPVTLEDC